MKLQWNLIIVFSTIMIVTVSIFAYITLEMVKDSYIEIDLHEMKDDVLERELRMENLHERASKDLVFALKNPLFVEYFELPETKAGNVFEDGVLQFTDKQREIKNKLEQHVYHFQNLYQVDETCIIDTSGQEHVRLVLKKIETDENLSPDEKSNPFFEPSFQKQRDQVHIQYPYLSPDTHRWVMAYTSPIVLGDETKPAFYHFEMPIGIFQDLVNVDHGRMYVIDPDGFIIADSEHQFPSTNIPENFEDYFPMIDSMFPPAFADVLQEIKGNEDGFTSYQQDDEIHYVVYMQLPTFGWYLIMEETEELILSEHSTGIGSIQLTFGVIAALVISLGLIGIILLSQRITKPIILLRNATKEIENGMLEYKINIKGADELKDLSKSFEHMVKSLRKTIELEKELALTQAELKNEKLAAIGELAASISHDIRNPLSNIKMAKELLSKRIEPNEKNKADLLSMDRGIKRISNQIENVLDFVRTKPLELEKYPIKNIVDSAITLSNVPDSVKIIRDGDNPEILCDQKAMEIVLLNLIDNSIHILDGRGEIRISITDSNQHVSIQVQDSGVGIPAEKIKHIFEPLYTTKFKGTGLGLSTVKNLVEQHHGRIEFKNNPTTFTIILPKSFDTTKQEKND